MMRMNARAHMKLVSSKKHPAAIILKAYGLYLTSMAKSFCFANFTVNFYQCFTERLRMVQFITMDKEHALEKHWDVDCETSCRKRIACAKCKLCIARAQDVKNISFEKLLPVLHIVLSYCTLNDALSLVSVSKELTNEIAESVHGLDVVQWRKNVTDKNIVSLSTKFTSARSLQLTGCAKLTDLSLENIGNNMLEINSLYLKGCDKITDNGILSLSNLNSLSHLDLGYCNEVTTVAMQSIAKMTNLRTLNLRSCKNVTDDGVAMLSSLTKLESLNLWYCNQGQHYRLHLVHLQ